jgi:hypothetical protein
MITRALASLVWVRATLSVGAGDGTGHMLVAQIVHDRLNAKARVRVDAIAAQLDNHGTLWGLFLPAIASPHC